MGWKARWAEMPVASDRANAYLDLMGRNKRTTSAKFFALHPYCCLCGGKVQATTIEHAPPISLFLNRNLPSKDHTVPACARCNNGSRTLDQVASLAALTQGSATTITDKTYVERAIEGVANNIPEALQLFQIADSTDIDVVIGNSLFELSKVPIDPLLFELYLDPWAAKQAFALYYLKTGKILGEEARVVVRWITNIDVDSENVPTDFINLLRNDGFLMQGIKNSTGQFNYRWQLEESYGCFVTTLHDSSMTLLAIYLDSRDAQKHMNLPVFATNPEEGIHRVSTPWFTVGPHNIPGTT